MPNKELLWATLHHIETHPETWDQRKWACGTSHCFAGHAAVTILKGELNDDEQIELTAELAALLNRWEVDFGLSVCPWIEGDTPHVGRFAEAALGLTTAQADDLFCPVNTLATLRHLVEQFTGESRPVLNVPRETSGV